MAELFKSVMISSFKAYIDGDSASYVKSCKLPEIRNKKLDLDNNSFGGSVGLYDPFEYEMTGEGEIIIEGTAITDLVKFFDPTRIRNLNITMAESNLNSQLGLIVPYPVAYKMNVQFGGNDLGEVMGGVARTHTVKFVVLDFSMKVDGREVVMLDFVNKIYINNLVDLTSGLLAAVS